MCYNYATVNEQTGKNIMSRKHFIDFANEIAALEDRKAARAAADIVATVASRHNYNFNPARFYAACGLENN